MNSVMKIVKDISIISAIIAAMLIIGATLNALMADLWIYLTYLFIIVRTSAGLFGFMIDLPTLWTTTGIVLSAWAAYWVFDISMIIAKYFRK